MKIYIASSWKNKVGVKTLAEAMRVRGQEVYCFAEAGEKWKGAVGR